MMMKTIKQSFVQQEESMAWWRLALWAAAMLLAVLAAGMAHASPQNFPAVDTLSVPVMKEHVRQGEIITEAMVTTRDMPARSVPLKAILQKESLIGLETVRMVRAAAPIMETQVRLAPSVRRGSHVSVLFNRGGVELSVEGEAMQDGNTGDTIRVNAASGAIIMAKVVANGQLVVQ